MKLFEQYGLVESMSIHGSDGEWIDYRLLSKNDSFRQMFDHVPANSALSIEAIHEPNSKTITIAYFLRAIGTKEMFPRLGKIGMCRFLHMIKDRYPHVKKIKLQATPLFEDPFQANEMERNKLIKYYVREYGFEIAKLENYGAQLQAFLDDVLIKCEDDLSLGTLFLT
jgi:hypothetical protein